MCVLPHSPQQLIVNLIHIIGGWDWQLSSFGEVFTMSCILVSTIHCGGGARLFSDLSQLLISHFYHFCVPGLLCSVFLLKCTSLCLVVLHIFCLCSSSTTVIFCPVLITFIYLVNLPWLVRLSICPLVCLCQLCLCASVTCVFLGLCCCFCVLPFLISGFVTFSWPVLCFDSHLCLTCKFYFC